MKGYVLLLCLITSLVGFTFAQDDRTATGFIVGKITETHIDIFNITNYNSVVQPNYEFHSSAPRFLSENKRLPIFGLRIEF